MRIRQLSWMVPVGALALVLGTLAMADGGWSAERPAGWGAVFTLTNDPEGNELAVFERDAKGQLTKPSFVPTGGDGTGTSLGNQGALALSGDGDFLYAVNPGSHTLTVFRLTRRGPQVVQVVGSGGKRPISLTVHKDLLYVLNAGGAVDDEDCITGFEIRRNGRLRFLKGSMQRLSAASTAPAQVSFTPSGDALIVTEKDTNKIASFAVNRKGLPVGRVFTASAGQTPFGFEFSRAGFLIVSEAFGGAPGGSAVSSYDFDSDEGVLETISASVPTKQTAACWIATTRNGEYAYTTNTASNSVTGYKISEKGTLTRLTEDGVTAETGTAPTDNTVLGNKVLFVLNRNDGTIGVYDIQEGGTLKDRQLLGGLRGAIRPTGLIVR